MVCLPQFAPTEVNTVAEGETLTIFAQALKTAANFAVEGVEDLVLLPKVTEEGITDNIKKRYMLDKIYVRERGLRSFFDSAAVLPVLCASLAILCGSRDVPKYWLSVLDQLAAVRTCVEAGASRFIFGGSSVSVCVMLSPAFPYSIDSHKITRRNR